jgi:hypothetical protein
VSQPGSPGPEDAAERQGGDKQRTEDAFHGALSFGWRLRITTLKEKLIKIGAKVVSHGRYVAFQMAEVAIPRTLFADILRLVAELRPSPAALST